ncbi:hypothetical protein [Natrinema sp. 74]|uniref:hypothetical protein n=1 Tax=Natrinema sp. 74 TaxID=3384159 RepID=UPI0038D4FF2A
MQRRTILKRTGIGLSIGTTAALAGCTGSGGTDTNNGGDGGNSGPFSATLSSTALFERDYQDNLVYVTLTLEGNPNTWPEFTVLGTTYRGYRPKISEGADGNVEDVSILYKSDYGNWTTSESWMFAKSEFENDQSETEYVVLGSSGDLEAGTEFVLYIKDPETGETTELGSVTYEGDPAVQKPTEHS